MPSYAHIFAKLPCPQCGAIIPLTADLVAFQWGYCPSRQPHDPLFYRLGESVLWRMDDNGKTPAWTYFEGALQAGNLGDPAIADLVVRALDLGGSDVECAACGQIGAGIRIEAGRLKAFVLPPVGCDIAIVEKDGRMMPRPDWDDHPMPDMLRARTRELVDGEGKVMAGKRVP